MVEDGIDVTLALKPLQCLHVVGALFHDFDGKRLRMIVDVVGGVHTRVGALADGGAELIEAIKMVDIRLRQGVCPAGRDLWHVEIKSVELLAAGASQGLLGAIGKVEFEGGDVELEYWECVLGFVDGQDLALELDVAH